MRKLASLCILSAFSAVCLPLGAEEPAEKTHILCDVADPANQCPGDKCPCVGDTFEVTFDGATKSVLEYDTFTQDLPIAVTIMTDTTVTGVQGWSYAVAHVVTDVTLVSVTIDTDGKSTDAGAKFNGGFNATSMEKVQTCGADADCVAANRTSGGGWLSAVVLSLMESVELDVKRNSIAKANYTLSRDVGTAGSVIGISKRIAKEKSPPVAINVTVSGNSKNYTTAIDGWIKAKGGVVVEICDNNIDDDGDTFIDCLDSDCPACPAEICNNDVDDDKDGFKDCQDSDCTSDPNCTVKVEICDNNIDDDSDTFIDCLDSDCPACPAEICNNDVDDDKDGFKDCLDTDCATDPACTVACKDWALYFGASATDGTVALGGATEYVISLRNKTAALGFQLGVKQTTAGGTSTWEFAGTLGTDANRLIELIVTDDQGNSQTPEVGNKATSTIEQVATIERGSAVSAFSARDFFVFDDAPVLGGPGFTVGYVADMNPTGAGNKIVATGSGTPCPLNEILKVKLGTADTSFSRGDADGNGKINVSDAVLIVQIVVGNLAKRFNCDDVLDANDDGTINVTDAIPVLQYVFQKGAPLAAPFRVCGSDTTADSLACTQANCN